MKTQIPASFPAESKPPISPSQTLEKSPPMEFYFREGQRKPAIFPSPADRSSQGEREIARDDAVLGRDDHRDVVARGALWRRLVQEEVRREIQMELLSGIRRAGVGFGLGVRYPGTMTEEASPRKLLTLSFVEERRLLSAAVEDDVPNTSAIGTKRKQNAEWNCPTCQICATSETALDEHFKGKRHKARETQIGDRTMTTETSGGSSSTLTVAPESWVCELCDVKMTCEKNFEMHLNGKKHKANEKTVESEGYLHDKDGKIACPCSHPVCLPTVLQSKEKMAVNDGKGVDDASADIAGPVEQACSSTTAAVLAKPVAEAMSKDFWCDLCNVKCTSKHTLMGHYQGKKHMAKACRL